MLGLVKDFSREVKTNMNKSDEYFAWRSAILDEFLDRARPLVDPRKKLAYMFDFPKGRIENLEEQVTNGLALRLAEYFYFQIEISAKRRVFREVVRSRIENSKQAQARAKYRGEESPIMSEDQVEREASRELSDLWSAAVEHLSVM